MQQENCSKGLTEIKKVRGSGKREMHRCGKERSFNRSLHVAKTVYRRNGRAPTTLDFAIGDRYRRSRLIVLAIADCPFFGRASDEGRFRVLFPPSPRSFFVYSQDVCRARSERHRFTIGYNNQHGYALYELFFLRTEILCLESLTQQPSHVFARKRNLKK